MKNKIIIIIFMILAVILAVISWILLPDSVIVQFGIDGKASNTMSKPFAVALSLVTTGIGVLMGFLADSKESRKGDFKKCVVIMAAGIIVMVIMLIVNR